MLANHETTQVLLRRYQIMREMRNFLNHGGFVEVQTPILSTAAGGAVARPFATSATEFADKQLSLRIAPELWLKRLILGGMDRIFEIGPCFRNEGQSVLNATLRASDTIAGLDKFHNPEFTTCEFYNAYATLQDLLKITEMMLYTIVNNVQALSAKNPGDPNRLPRSKMPPLAVDADFFKGPYPRIDFISALNEALGRKLPALGVESATRELVEIFQEKNIPLPAQLTLPRLLDKLSATYLEPQCDKPTWIINHPECLSPLSKSFFHTSPSVDQPVAARAELFVRGHEIVNCYEEENSPFEQRRKFMMQQQHAKADGSGTADPEAMKVDEEYLRALEWGLPPTGGWGCGIDRLVMLIIGKQRIGDVLAFGNLRSVTRIPGPREMAGLARSPIPTLEEKRNQASVSEAQKQATTDIIQAPDPSDLGTETKKTNPEIDPVEEAVIKIRKDYRRESIRSKRRRGDSDSSSPGKKRLATWLAGRGGSDAAEWLISK